MSHNNPHKLTIRIGDKVVIDATGAGLPVLVFIVCAAMVAAFAGWRGWL